MPFEWRRLERRGKAPIALSIVTLVSVCTGASRKNERGMAPTRLRNRRRRFWIGLTIMKQIDASVVSASRTSTGDDHFLQNPTVRGASLRLLITIIPEPRSPSSGSSLSQFHPAPLAPPDATISSEYAPHSPHDTPRPPQTSPTHEGVVPFRMWAFPRARIKSNLGLLGSVQLFA
jgi:hypothetical protein